MGCRCWCRASSSQPDFVRRWIFWSGEGPLARALQSEEVLGPIAGSAPARGEVRNEGGDALFSPVRLSLDPSCHVIRNVDGALCHIPWISANYISGKRLPTCSRKSRKPLTS